MHASWSVGQACLCVGVWVWCMSERENLNDGCFHVAFLPILNKLIECNK